MAKLNREGADLVYRAAEQFKDTVLRDVHSLFTPNRVIWTLTNVEEIYDRVIGHPDVSSSTFIDKLHRQLANADPDVIQLMGEMLYVHSLMPKDITGRTKRQLINTVLQWSKEPVKIASDLDKALDFGIANVGVNFTTGRPWQLGFLMRFAISWLKSSPEERDSALSNPWAFKQYINPISVEGGYSQREALLHLIFPEAFESMVSRRHKQRIVEELSEGSNEPEPDIDRQLATIRANLEPQFGKDFTFYSPEVKALWDVGTTARDEVFLGKSGQGSEEEIEDDVAQPPPGYKAARLGEIAEFTIGIAVRDLKSEHSDVRNPIYFVRMRDLQQDGSIHINKLNVIAQQELQLDERGRATLNRHSLQSGDILLGTFASKIRIGIIGGSVVQPLTFDRTLIRIRVNPALANPKQVFEFLQSDTGQLALRKSVVAGTIPHVTSRGISEIVIFLPPLAASREQIAENLSVAARAVREINNEILPLLNEAETNVEIAEIGGKNLPAVAQKLRELAATLVVPSLSETVPNLYPTPIALSFRRFYDSRFNVYEQVLRLRDLYEAAAYFVYHVALADVLQRLDCHKYHIADKRTRNAYDYSSMRARIEFVARIIEHAKSNGGRDLFVQELVDSECCNYASKLQSFRNELSHTQTASESRQKRILGEFQPIVEQMLRDLEFLIDYRLVRIPSIYFSKGHWFRQMEIYQGAVPSYTEQVIMNGFESAPAERNHLVLLNSDEEILDLYPFYQLVASEQTRDETHLCFLKQRKGQTQLEGESVSAMREVSLAGSEELNQLLVRAFGQRNG